MDYVSCLRRWQIRRLFYFAVALIVLFGSTVHADQRRSDPSPPTVSIYSKVDANGNCTDPLDTRDVYAKKGGEIDVYVYMDEIQDVKFDEKERHTRFYNDVQSVLGSVVKGAAPAPAPQHKCVEYHHTYQFDRSTLTVTGYDASGKPVTSVIVVAGPKEHAFLGLDLAINNGKTLKYDSSSNSLIPQSSSPQLYLSFNWFVGDILTDAQKLSWFDNFSGKVLFSASSKPLDSVGLGIGYRIGNVSVFEKLKLDGLSVFFGHFWTKEDTISGGHPELNGHYKQAWRFGVTYDVGSALKWVKW